MDNVHTQFLFQSLPHFRVHKFSLIVSLIQHCGYPRIGSLAQRFRNEMFLGYQNI